MIGLIVAIGENKELGKDNKLLWHLPDDLKFFKKKTLDKPIIMGRKTYESLPGILPRRTHIVLSKNLSIETPSVIVVSSIGEAFLEASKISDDYFVIGGGELYKQTLPMVDEIFLTKVHATFESDTFFPDFDTSVFDLMRRTYHTKDSKHPYSFEFFHYRKKSE